MSTNNKVTKEYIESRITSVHFAVPELPGGPRQTVAYITIENGHISTGESWCTDPANFDREMGEQIAYENAFRKLWELEGYLLNERMFQENQQCQK